MAGPIGLLDLIARREKVHVKGSGNNGGGEYLEVRGVSAQDVAALLKQFPTLEKIFMGRGITIDDLRALAHDCIGSIIAAGVGKLGDEEVEKAANALSLEFQTDLIEAIGRATLPSGFGPFANRVTAAFGGLHSAPVGRPPVMNSPKESRPLVVGEIPLSGPSPPDRSPPTAS
jgi:hypothetical protein